MARRSLLRRILSTSGRVPFKAHETAKQRHARRFEQASHDRPRFKSWCDRRGLGLRLDASGEHWEITSEGVAIAHWWPRVARLSYPPDLTKQTHCHDIDQVREAIAKRLKVAG